MSPNAAQRVAIANKRQCQVGMLRCMIYMFDEHIVVYHLYHSMHALTLHRWHYIQVTRSIDYDHEDAYGREQLLRRHSPSYMYSTLD